MGTGAIESARQTRREAVKATERPVPREGDKSLGEFFWRYWGGEVGRDFCHPSSYKQRVPSKEIDQQLEKALLYARWNLG